MKCLPICPFCDRESYRYTEGGEIKCIGCGALYTYFGTARRCEERLKVNRGCTITNKEMGRSIEAVVEDVSFSGARIRYAGTAFYQDSIVHLDADDLDLHTPARVVWTKAMSKSKKSTGLQLIWPPKAVSIAV
jgi:hypothetical protein